jgi:methyltransferase, FkbM family
MRDSQTAKLRYYSGIIRPFYNFKAVKFKLFGRRIQSLAIPGKAYSLAVLWWQMRIFNNWAAVFTAYMFKRPLSSIYLNNGWQIHLSTHPADVATVALIFCKQDYGKDFAGKSIIDIGANIGAFSIFAALQGARKVISIEPSQESFDLLTRNIAANGLEHIITPLQHVVTSSDGQVLKFPSKSSPNNKLSVKGTSEGFTDVTSITLDTLSSYCDNRINILKIDCEGGEYDILQNQRDFSIIPEIRMELHGSNNDKSKLIAYLKNKGYSIPQHSSDNIWLTQY